MWLIMQIVVGTLKIVWIMTNFKFFGNCHFLFCIFFQHKLRKIINSILPNIITIDQNQWMILSFQFQRSCWTESVFSKFCIVLQIKKLLHEVVCHPFLINYPLKMVRHLIMNGKHGHDLNLMNIAIPICCHCACFIFSYPNQATPLKNRPKRKKVISWENMYSLKQNYT